MGNDNSEGIAWQAKHFIPKPLIARVTTLYGEQLSVEEKERETECASGGPGSPMVASATSSPMVTAPGLCSSPSQPGVPACMGCILWGTCKKGRFLCPTAWSQNAKLYVPKFEFHCDSFRSVLFNH